MKRVDYSGRRYGRLLVLSMVYEAGKDAKARCACDCGAEKTVTAYNLNSGNTESCGCLARERTAERNRALLRGSAMGKANRTHGYSRTPTYASWCDARKRCYSPQNKRFSEYGGRGIGMCDAWRDSFESFLRDMGERPKGMTLERLDVDKWYEPGNCTWATAAQQAQNTRANVADWDSVRAMRKRRAEGATYQQLASDFGMSYNNVRLICRGESWKEDGHAQ